MSHTKEVKVNILEINKTMEELIILVEALQKGIDKNIYTNLEIKGIQVCIDKLTNTLNQDINVLQDKDNQTTEE